MLSFTASKYKNGGTAGPKSGVDMQGGMAVICRLFNYNRFSGLS
jgi:hypothetical protein